MGPASPAVVVFTRHAELRALERGLDLQEIADLLSRHDRRRRNPGPADWLVRGSSITIVYNWPDGDDQTAALVLSAWRG